MESIPQVGQTVLVRGRPYLVESISPQAAFDAEGVQHLVHLTCLDENSLDERLFVVWEMEPGAEVREHSSLPALEKFDAPDDLDAFLHAVRWGVVSQMDHSSMQAPFRSGIEPEDYQLEPVAKALTMPRVNLLLADDVGLGKTIEAGLVVEELMLRNRLNTVLVVCPSSLQVQWKEEMRDKFGLEFRIINSESVSLLRRKRGIHVNPWTHFPRLITSIDYLKQDRVLQRFCETLPAEGEKRWPRRYDMLIVDEAHNIAPAGSLNYVKASLRTKAIRTISPHFEHRMFLTATPHNGYRESFSALLEILDDQRFVRGMDPDRGALSQVLVRRMKTEIVDAFGRPRFPARRVQALEVEYGGSEVALYGLLQRYCALCAARHAASATAGRAVQFVMKLLKKRFFSSPYAFSSSVDTHVEGRKKGAVSDAAFLHMRLPDMDELVDDEGAEMERDAMAFSSGAMGATAADEEWTLLLEMQKKAAEAARHSDAKARALVRWLKENLCPEGRWNDTRVVIFTEYRDTQNYLAELLCAVGLGGERLRLINGSTPSDEREAVKAAFQASPGQAAVRILLGTDAASEGINLQNWCSHLIHYEIPWNPGRLEQRNGRIDRHGQRAPKVDIYHFIAAGGKEAGRGEGAAMLKADMDFLFRVVQKVENIRMDLGKVGPVLARQVEDTMLAVGGAAGRAPARADQDAEVERAAREARAAQRMLKVDRDIKKALADVRDKLEQTRHKLLLTPGNVRHTVEVALRLAGQPPLVPAKVKGLPEGSAFMLPALTGAWGFCREGNAHPHTHEPRPIVFDGDLARGRDDVVLAHLNHRLVNLSLQTLRSQLWASPMSCRLHRAAVRQVPSSLTSAPVVVLLGRMIVSGSTNQRILEEMIMAGGRMREGRFARMGVQELEKFWNAAMALPGSVRAVQEEVAVRDIWPAMKEQLYAALEARLGDRVKTLQSRIDSRVAEEEGRIRAVMSDLEKNIRAELQELKAPSPRWLSLLDAEEKQTHNADVAVLERRLRNIPRECDEEIAHLHARYGSPRTNLLPLAVCWFIPASCQTAGEH
ncbi:DISARM system SNF2-like helicase DrmD [Mailhella massiliensis]|uniref:DISARM system SNF2-like helicase DrmD n=1 Tax=Mailhella massiliensis TaxID=1903261 RepID=UPI002357DD05|nr:DISARM system SNF2-like helicase DrmD [Mailhella massiliensis]